MLSIELKNDLGELKRLHEAIQDLGHVLSIPKKALYHINLALEEIFTNIVNHGFRDEKEHCIKVSADREGHVLCFRIEDDGVPFNPLKAKPPELKAPMEERPLGGLGCYLMRCCMDDVKYERRRGRNILVLKRDLRREKPRAGGPC